jgi:hypothetical protein
LANLGGGGCGSGRRRNFSRQGLSDVARAAGAESGPRDAVGVVWMMRKNADVGRPSFERQKEMDREYVIGVT